MKKYLHGILMCLMTFVVLFSCTKPEPNEPSINLYVTPSTLDFDEEGGSKNVTIKTNATSWNASASSQDIRLSATFGSGDGTLTVSMGPSHSSQNTEGSVEIVAGSQKSTVIVRQTGLSLKVGTLNKVPAEGGIFDVDIEYNTSFEVKVTEGSEWLSHVATKSSKNGKISLAVAMNNSSSERTGKVVVTDNNGVADSQTITVVQEAGDGDRAIIQSIIDEDGGTEILHALSGRDVDGYINSIIFNVTSFEGKLTERLFDKLSGLEHLKKLVFDGRTISGSLYDNLGKLTHLESLSVFYTSVEGNIPDVFGDMPELRRIEIVGNSKITGSIPASIAECKLEFLNLEGNDLTGPIPSGLAYVNPDLSFNRLTGSIPSEYYKTANPGVSIARIIYQHGDGLDIGDKDIPAPFVDGPVTDYDGNTFRFKDVIAKNKLTVHLYWATWCPFSKGLLPQLQVMYNRYHNDGLEVIATAAAESYENSPEQNDALVQNTILEKGYNWYSYSWYKNYKDKIVIGSEFMDRYQYPYPAIVPACDVIDSNGNVVFSTNTFEGDTKGRFGKTASEDLIPFLESVFGPMMENDSYESEDFSQDGKVLTLQKAAAGDGINLVLLGNGYVDKDMAKDGLYEKLMKQSMEEFFAVEPFKTFRDRFNVYAVKAVSKSCITDGAHETALGATYDHNTSGISQGIDKCYEYAMKVPGISTKDNLVISVLVNSWSSFGLTHIDLQTSSAVATVGSFGNDGAAFGGTLRHEAGGHAFGFLADEYFTRLDTPSHEYIEGRKEQQTRYGAFLNVDYTGDSKQIRWRNFLEDPLYKDEVGVYEGGDTFGKGVWRSSESSLMRESYLEYFNAVSRDIIFRRIMTLSGEEYSWDKFVEYDAVNRGKTKAASASTQKKSETRHYSPLIVD